VNLLLLQGFLAIESQGAMKIVFFLLRQPEVPSMTVHQLHTTYSARHCCALSLCELVPPQFLAESFWYGLTDYLAKPLSGKPSDSVSQWILEEVGSHCRDPLHQPHDTLSNNGDVSSHG